jgi:hypothetical protein
MEMIDGHTGVLGLMAVSLASSMISRLISAPLYHSLARLQLPSSMQDQGNADYNHPVSADDMRNKTP